MPCQRLLAFVRANCLRLRFRRAAEGDESSHLHKFSACGSQLLRLGARRPEDRRPAGDLRLDESFELGRRALLFCRDRSAEIGQALLDVGVVKRPVERGRELVDDLLARALRREYPGPDAHLIVDAGLLRRRHVWQCREALIRGHAVSLDAAGRNLRRDADRLLAEEIDVSADQVVQCRSGAAIATSVGCTAVAAEKSRHAMCDDEPMPPCACFTPLPFLLRYCMNSPRSAAGKSFLATIAAGACAVKPIGSKSRSESYLMLGVSIGAATCDPMLP